ncbi:MAG: PASTA domain-containing protein [Erysipelotrichaceae bacterium]
MEFTLNQDLFPEWELVELIGEGSFGKVYLIRKKLLNGVTYSALKVITIPQSSSQIKAEKANGMKDQEITEYFKSIVDDWHKEIIFLDSLKGITNIVNIEDYKIVKAPNEIRWDIYIRMEYVTNFNDVIVQEAMTDKEALKLGIDICQALVYCRKRNIIHRDIKPENIFRSSFGDYKLGDFGIARQVEKTNSSLSKKGTYLYMAPEVYNGKQYDSRADIYSLGLVLHKLFNGNQIPFVSPEAKSILHSDKESSISRRMNGDEIPVSEKLPTQIQSILRKACSFDPTQRYAGPEEFMTDLVKARMGLEKETVLFDFSESFAIDSSSEKSDNGIVTLTKPTETQDQTEGIFINKVKTDETAKPFVESVPLAIAQEADRSVQYDKTEGVFTNDTKRGVQKNKTEEKAVEVIQNEKKVNSTLGNSSVKKVEIGYLPVVDKKKGKQSRKIILGLGVLAVLILLFGFGSKIFMQKPFVMPDLVDSNVSEIEENLKMSLFTIKYEYVTDDNKEEGTVVSQSISKDSEVSGKKELVLTITNKTKYVDVPQGEGKSLAEFKSKLEELGLQYTVNEVYHSSIASGVIVSHQPASGENIKAGSSITIEVSKGEAPIQTVVVPNGVGKTLDQFTTTLKGLGLTYSVSKIHSDKIAIGVVISHTPGSTKSVNIGTNIEIVVSKGTWSSWVTALPSGVDSTKYTIEQNKQYRYSDKSTTTNSSPTLDGWTKYNETYVYGAWSGWVNTVITKTSTVDVGTQQLETKNYKTVYSYTSWTYVNKDTNVCWSSYGEYTGPVYKVGSGRWNNKSVDYNPLPTIGSTDGHTKYGTIGDCATIWWNQTSAQVYANSTYTTQYRSRSITTTYYYYKWADFSAWSETSVTATADKKVETRNIYRYRLK